MKATDYLKWILSHYEILVLKGEKVYMKKRIIAILLSLCLVISLMPATALAGEPVSVETEEQLLNAIAGATDNAENPTVIQITKNIELSKPLVIQAGKNCIINGNYHKITRDSSVIWENAGNRKDLLTIFSDVTLNNLTIDAKGSSGHNVCALVVSGSEEAPANVIANNVIIENGYSDKNALAGIYMSNSTFVLNGGEIRGNHAKSAAAIRIDANATFTMKSGKIHSNSVKTYETTPSNALGPVVSSWSGNKDLATVNFINGEVYDNKQIYTSGYNLNTYANSLGAVNTGAITFNLSGDVKFSNNYAVLEGSDNRMLNCDISGTFNLISELKNSLNLKYYNSKDIYATGKDYTIISSDVAKMSLVSIPAFPEGTICYLDAQNNQVKPGIARTITFNANDGYGEPDTATQVVPSGVETALKENTFTRDGYIFTGWNTAADGSGTKYTDKITTDADVPLYAQWAPASGTCGATENDDVSWTLTENSDARGTYTLTISGTGAMKDFNKEVSSANGSDRPWIDLRSKISSVNVEAGITYIGSYSFANFTILKSVILPETLQTIRNNAFYYAGSSAGIENLNLPSGLQCIEYGAFTHCVIKQNIVEIPETVSYIGSQALQFKSGNNLSTVSLVKVKSPILTVGNNAFMYGGQVLDLSDVNSLLADGTITYLSQACRNTLAYVASDAYISWFNTLGTHIKAVAVTDGGTFPTGTTFIAGTLATPTKTGYTFGGWYTDKELTTEAGYNEVDGVKQYNAESGKTYYAKWIGLSATDISMHYSDTRNVPAIAGVTLSNWQSTDTSVVTISDNQLKAVGIGTTTITADASTTSGGFGTLEVTVTVTEKPISVTMSDSTVAYDGSAKTIDAAAGEGATIPDGLTLVYSYKKFGEDDSAYISTPPTAAGTYTVKVASGDDNYTLTGTTEASLTINPASLEGAVVTPEQDVFPYMGSEIKPNAIVTMGDTTLVKEQDYTVTYSNNVSRGTATITVTGKGNYTGTKTGNFTVSPATVTITAENKSMYVNGTLPTYTYTVTGLIGDDELTKEPTLTCSADGKTTGKYEIVANSAEVGDNYTITYVNGALTVSPVYYIPPVQKPVIDSNDNAKTELSSDGTKLTITAEEGYKVVDVLVNGLSKGAVTELTGLKTGDKVEVVTEKVEESAADSDAEQARIEKIIKGVEDTTLKARSTKTEKGIKITWEKSKGYKVDYYEIYRSTKRYSGYGKEPFFTTKSGEATSYTNTKDLTKGTTYYYKVRGVRIIDGKKVYTEYSTKAWRTW